MPAPAPRRSGWLVLSGALGLVMVLVVGEMNLFQEDLLPRWLVLAAGWLAAALLGRGLWKRVPIPASAFGAAVAAVVINLLAAGGIGFPERRAGPLAPGGAGAEPPGGPRLQPSSPVWTARMPGFALAIVWAALAGSFFGAITAVLAIRGRGGPRRCRAATSTPGLRAGPGGLRPGEGSRSLQCTTLAGRRLSSAPDLAIARLQARRPALEEDPGTPAQGRLTSTQPLRRHAAQRAGQGHPGSSGPGGSHPLPEGAAPASGQHRRGHAHGFAHEPHQCELHARLAEASAEISMFQDAVTEAQEALRLDECSRPTPTRN